MFTGTLRFNIDPEERCKDARIMELLKAAQLEEVLQKSPLGLN